MEILKSVAIGISAGFVTGLFSTGGGMLVLPAIIYLLKIDEKKARATTIFIILPMVLTSAFFYYANKNFDIKMGIKCAIGGIVGSYIGSKILRKISDEILKVIFIFFLLYASYNMIR